MGEDVLDRFAAGYQFKLDEFQSESLAALARGESILVAAPTGSGKTVVAEFAVWLAVTEGRKAFYTTPLKALSNQKFGDLVAAYGPESVGLLTGDNSINSQAPIVVMTTEVLRNMIYERSDLLRDLRYVILDEVHYLQDPYRGAVWEEVIIHLPVDVKIICLSATVSNAEEFADWIQTVRGTTSAVIEERRPVRLELHYMIEDRLHPMFIKTVDEVVPNPQIRRLESRSLSHRSRSSGRRGGPRRRMLPRRADVIELLESQSMLPAIYFIFSRRGCDQAVADCARAGIGLTNSSERKRIREYAEMRCDYLEDDDLVVLGYAGWLEALVSGIAAHHAGLIPVFKETVEELFQGGLVKAVFATETLSLGINMPARSVVIESLTKFTGERHEVMTAGEFTQLTGRAGRRGIDTLGHTVVLQQRDITFQQIAGLASTRTFPLLSSFQPSYNMATNLVRNYDREAAEHLLNSSFAQYRVDKEVVVKERQIERNDAYLASYREKMHCERGDFAEYWGMRQRMSRLERSLARWEQTAGREQTRTALELARPGHVYVIPRGKQRGPVVVVGREKSRRGEPRLLAVNRERKLIRLTASDFPRSPRPVANLYKGPSAALPKRTEGGIDYEARRQLASALEALELPPDTWSVEPLPEEREGTDLTKARAEMIGHPCHACPDRDRHAQWAERASRLERDTERLKKEIRARAETLSRKFERVLSVLEHFGYVEDFTLTDKGFVLARIYNESDLVLAEVLSKGWFDGLTGAEAAALVSTFVFESRGPFQIVGRLPTQKTKAIYKKIEQLTTRVNALENRNALDLTRGTETGFAETVFRWCEGAALEDVIDEESDPGDFIRSTKQTLDLLRQLQDATTGHDLRAVFGEAAAGLNRGVIAYTGVI